MNLTNDLRPGRWPGDMWRRVVVVGASRGIGEACARVLADHADELILADLDSSALRSVARELDASARFCDVSSEASVSVFAADLARSPTPPDLLINAAGESYVRTLGTMRICRALLPLMKRCPQPKQVVNIADLATPDGPSPFPYAASTEAFECLSDALAESVRGAAIDLITVLPESRLDQRAAIAEGSATPHRRVYADPDDPADLAERLFSLLCQLSGRRSHRPARRLGEAG